MDSLFTIKDLAKLTRLAKARNQSREDYFRFQKFQGELLVRFLRKNHCLNEGDLILDLGCAFGGYSSALKQAGARVVGLDFSPTKNPDGVPMVKGDANFIPAPVGIFDTIVCASLIEHIPDPMALLMECLRVLKPGGILYLSFPPYYSPIGGHQFAPYHLLGQKVALRMAVRRGLYKESPWLKERFDPSPEDYSEAFGKWGLYKMSIAKARWLIKKLPVTVIRRATRYLPVDFSGIPLIGELITWHVQFILRKL